MSVLHEQFLSLTKDSKEHELDSQSKGLVLWSHSPEKKPENMIIHETKHFVYQCNIYHKARLLCTKRASPEAFSESKGCLKPVCLMAVVHDMHRTCTDRSI